MDIYELMREIGEDTPEQDMMTDDMLNEMGMDETDFYFQTGNGEKIAVLFRANFVRAFFRVFLP